MGGRGQGGRGITLGEGQDGEEEGSGDSEELHLDGWLVGWIERIEGSIEVVKTLLWIVVLRGSRQQEQTKERGREMDERVF